LQSKFLGGMLGSALGDAIGELAFRSPEEEKLRSEVARADVLVYTDDTAMAIGLAESILELGHLDPQHLGDTFRINYLHEPWRGYAVGPPTIFVLVTDRGVSYSQAAQSLFGGQGSFGNGAAMRVAPVGLFFHDSAHLYEQARTSATVTHMHPIGIDGAAVLALAVAQAAALSPQKPFPLETFCQGLIAFARTVEIRDKMIQVQTLVAEQVGPGEAAWRLGQSVAVHESLPFALYSFLRYPQSYQACLLCAVLNGGDRDTLGAMAGAVSGAYLGFEAIPSSWWGKLENGQYIQGLARRLAELAKKMRRSQIR
jgi:poly(ADP-ribose) glycohydrolase ARH3